MFAIFQSRCRKNPAGRLLYKFLNQNYIDKPPTKREAFFFELL
jgi:hypothetical protein